MHTEDIRCIIWAFLLLWALRWNTWFCERSFRAVLAPPYSPATPHGAAGESVPPCCRLAAAPSHGPEGPPASRAHAVGSVCDHTAPDRPTGRSPRFENLGSCPSRHGPPRVSIGCFVSRETSGSGYWLVGRARARPRRRRGVVGCRAVEWPVRAPEGDVVWRARRGVPLLRGAAGRPGPAAGGR